jgi:hypothetical protein
MWNNCSAYNNISIDCGNGGIELPPGVSSGNNYIYSGTANNGYWVSYNQFSYNNNFNLTSLAADIIGQGVNESADFTTDFNGEPRPSSGAWDIGPYQYEACDAPPAGLVSWWAAEGNANDSFGANNGTLVDGVTFATGEVGDAFDFNGTSQYVDVPDSASINPTGSITVEAWINPSAFATSSAVGAPIIKKAGEGTEQQDGYAFQMGNTGGVYFYVYLSGGVGWVGVGPASVPLSEWSHIAGVYDGAHLSIYLNGVLVGTPVSASGAIMSSGNDLQIGHDPSNPSWYFGGLIDEASIYNTALSAAQIQAIYNAGSAGKCH